MLLTVEAVAERLDVSPSTVRRWVATGFLPTAPLPGRVLRIPLAALEAIPWQYAPTATPKAARAISLSSPKRASGSYAAALQALAEPKPKSTKRRSGAKSSPQLTLADQQS